MKNNNYKDDLNNKSFSPLSIARYALSGLLSLGLVLLTTSKACKIFLNKYVFFGHFTLDDFNTKFKGSNIVLPSNTLGGISQFLMNSSIVRIIVPIMWSISLIGLGIAIDSLIRRKQFKHEVALGVLVHYCILLLNAPFRYAFYDTGANIILTALIPLMGLLNFYINREKNMLAKSAFAIFTVWSSFATILTTLATIRIITIISLSAKTAITSSLIS